MRNYENDPRTLDSLVDIRDVKVDPAQPPEERIRSYVQQVKDPYCFRVGGVKVRVAYAGKDETLNDSFCNMILLYDQKTFPEENSIKRLEKEYIHAILGVDEISEYSGRFVVRPQNSDRSGAKYERCNAIVSCRHLPPFIEG